MGDDTRTPHFLQSQGQDLGPEGAFFTTAVKMYEARPLEVGEDPPDLAQIPFPLEKKVAALTPLDPLQSPDGRKVQDEHQIGLGGEALVQAADPDRVEPFGALVSDGRKIVTVEDDDPARFQAWADVLFHVFPAVAQKKIQFLGRRQGTRQFGLGPDLPTPASAGRLPVRNGVESQQSKRSQEHSGLGRLPGPIDAFDDE